MSSNRQTDRHKPSNVTVAVHELRGLITSVQVADATRKDSTLSKVLQFTKSGWQHTDEDAIE